MFKVINRLADDYIKETDKRLKGIEYVILIMCSVLGIVVDLAYEKKKIKGLSIPLSKELNIPELVSKTISMTGKENYSKLKINKSMVSDFKKNEEQKMQISIKINESIIKKGESTLIRCCAEDRKFFIEESR